MTGPTHRQYSICFGLITLIILYTYNITNVNYYLALLIILMASKSGALFPDVDHHWDAVHDKTVVNKVINTIIHLTGGKHRSWQTHSIDICACFTVTSYLIPNMLYDNELITNINKEVLLLLMLGFASGWVSHLFSDMLTSAGVRLMCFIPKLKIKLVPKKIGKLKFNTGHEWENFNFSIIKVLKIVLGVYTLIYPILTSNMLINIIEKWR